MLLGGLWLRLCSRTLGRCCALGCCLRLPTGARCARISACSCHEEVEGAGRQECSGVGG